jgi:hypothetical protein
MPFNVLLLPLLGGFIFVRYWNRTKYPAIRADKERILLLASTAGVIALGAAFTIKSILGMLFPCSEWPNSYCYPILWYTLVPFPYSAVSVFAFLMGALLWIPLNKGVYPWAKSIFTRAFWDASGLAFKKTFKSGWNDSDEIDRVINEDGNPLDMLLRLAEKGPKTISATLKSGKVYVGFVSSTNPPSSETRTVGILPTKSGYRDPITKQVHYPINYSYALLHLDQDIEDRLQSIRESRRIRRRLKRERAKKLALKAKVDNVQDKKALTSLQQAQLATIKAETRRLKRQMNRLRAWELDLRDEAEDIGEMIDDFRLVFLVDEISSISIFREEVNVDYFMAQTLQDSASKLSNPSDPSNISN